MKILISQIKGMDKRVRRSMSPEKLEELADSLKELGQIVPIKVRKNGDGYTLIYGHRRVAAAKMAGLKEIETIVEDVPEDALLTQALAENVIREDMPAIDIAKALAAIIDETGCTQEALGKKMGWAGQTVGSYLGMLAPELKSLARGIDHHHVIEAKAGTGGDLKLAARVLEKAGREGLSTRQTRDVAEAVKRAAELQGNRGVDAVLSKDYSTIKEGELRRTLDGDETSIPDYLGDRSQHGRRPTLTQAGPTHFEWLKERRVIAALEAVKIIDVGIRVIAAGDKKATTSGIEVLKQLKHYLEMLLKVVDAAIHKVGG